MNERGRRAGEWYARHESEINAVEWLLLVVVACALFAVVHC